eukprot:8028218-Pyramimonas_sp.AAC.1
MGGASPSMRLDYRAGTYTKTKTTSDHLTYSEHAHTPIQNPKDKPARGTACARIDDEATRDLFQDSVHQLDGTHHANTEFWQATMQRSPRISDTAMRASSAPGILIFFHIDFALRLGGHRQKTSATLPSLFEGAARAREHPIFPWLLQTIAQPHLHFLRSANVATYCHR